MPKPPNKFVWIVASWFVMAAVSAAEKTRAVWLVSNGFHSSLAVDADDFHAGSRLTGDPRPDYLLIGWGAADFYRGQHHFGTLVRSIFWPTASALHVIPVRGAVARRFRHSDVIRLSLSHENHRRLLADLSAAFTRGPQGRPVEIGRGYYPDSRFYAARDRFCLFQMCNTWTAKKLRRHGIRIFVPTAITASELARQATRAGTREERRRRPMDAF